LRSDAKWLSTPNFKAQRQSPHINHGRSIFSVSQPWAAPTAQPAIGGGTCAYGGEAQLHIRLLTTPQLSFSMLELTGHRLSYTLGTIVGVKSAPSSGAAHPGLAAFKKARSPAHPLLTLDHPSAYSSAHPPLTTASGD